MADTELISFTKREVLVIERQRRVLQRIAHHPTFQQLEGSLRAAVERSLKESQEVLV